MAIDLCSESSGLGMSPRISFSHDLCLTDSVRIEECYLRSDSSLLESSSDFDFGVSESFEQESSSADELFFDGKILPRQVWGKNAHPKQTHQAKPPPPPPPRPPRTSGSITTDSSKKESLKEIIATSSESEEKAPSKSFWRFRRSSSLNCGNEYKRSLICSLPLLSRSNSTGSAPNPKRQPLLKDNQKHSQKPPSKSSSSSSSSSSLYSYSSLQKPPLKKNYGSYGNGVRISPVLNVPPPYISKGTANLLGLGSFFCSGKDKNKKK